MEELRLERKFFTAPERALWQEPDCPIVIVVDVSEVIRQLFVGRLVRFGGKVSRHLPDVGPVERCRLSGGGGQKPRRQPRYQRHSGSSEEISTIHETNLAVTD